MRSPLATRHSPFVLGVVFLCALPLSCREQKEPPKIRSIMGTVKEIDRKSGRVTMRIRDDEHGIETEGDGWATSETEILIDGRLATLADVRRDDRASILCRVEKRGDEKRFIATKVEITRGTPTTQPSR